MDDFPAWIRLTHLFNILFLTLLARSGLEILSSLPKLYWNEHCAPGTEWLRLTRKRVPHDRLWTSLEEEESFPSWLALPGRHHLGLGRHWHFATALGWIATGVVYVVLLFLTPEWRRLVPTSWSVFPGAFDAAVAYLRFDLPPPGDPYNALQQLVYFLVVFALSPLTIATGIAMSPALAARFPSYLRLFRGKQGARSVHFVCLLAFVLFTLMHTAMVLAHGLPNELALIVLGSERESHALALAIGVAALAALLLVHVAATVASLRRPRLAQRALGSLVDPLQRALSRLAASKQDYREDEASPYFRVNGLPPGDAAYGALAEREFADWRLHVGGLVERPLSLSLDDLRALERRVQVTKHHCIQGWTAVAEWAGVPLARVLDLAGPRPSARYVVLYAFDDKAETAVAAEPAEGRFYEAIDIGLADDAQTILAYEMNGGPLPVPHGAPVRLRVETQLGFKMVKWIRAIELVEDFSAIGEGQGGWKEDKVQFSNAVAL